MNANSFKSYLEDRNIDVRRQIFPNVLNKEYKMSLSVKMGEFRGSKQAHVQIVKIQ